MFAAPLAYIESLRRAAKDDTDPSKPVKFLTQMDSSKPFAEPDARIADYEQRRDHPLTGLKAAKPAKSK